VCFHQVKRTFELFSGLLGTCRSRWWVNLNIGRSIRLVAYRSSQRLNVKHLFHKLNLTHVLNNKSFINSRIFRYNDVAKYMAEVARAALGWGVPFLLYWEFYSNNSTIPIVSTLFSLPPKSALYLYLSRIVLFTWLPLFLCSRSISCGARIWFGTCLCVGLRPINTRFLRLESRPHSGICSILTTGKLKSGLRHTVVKLARGTRPSFVLGPHNILKS
jgi:hypothetical protein